MILHRSLNFLPLRRPFDAASLADRFSFATSTLFCTASTQLEAYSYIYRPSPHQKHFFSSSQKQSIVSRTCGLPSLTYCTIKHSRQPPATYALSSIWLPTSHHRTLGLPPPHLRNSSAVIHQVCLLTSPIYQHFHSHLRHRTHYSSPYVPRQTLIQFYDDH